MMIVSNYPQQTTYWIISVDNAQVFGSTNPDQITEGPNSLVIDYISEDETEWKNKCLEFGLVSPEEITNGN